jgi:hypothetical protein
VKVRLRLLWVELREKTSSIGGTTARALTPHGLCAFGRNSDVNPVLRNARVFDPEALAAMDEAFDAAWKALMSTTAIPLLLTSCALLYEGRREHRHQAEDAKER